MRMQPWATAMKGVHHASRPWKTMVLIVVVTGMHYTETTEVLYRPPLEELITVSVKANDPRGGPQQTVILQVRGQVMKSLGITKEEVECGEVILGEDGHKKAVRVKNHVFPIPETEVNANAMVFHSVPSEEPYLLDLNVVGHLTVESFKDDQTLVPETPLTLDWAPPRIKRLETLEILVSKRSATIIVNGEMISHHKTKQDREGDPWLEDAGLLVAVINPSTSSLTLQQVFSTNDYGAHRDLKWTLQTIQPGRVIIVASVHDGSLQLDEVRPILEGFGSEWVTQYLFRDSWIWVFVKGGVTLEESLVPNLQNSSFPASPLKVHVNISSRERNTENTVEKGEEANSDFDWSKCSGWEQSMEWQKRAVFCSSLDGFGDLCDCEHPFTISSHAPRDKPVHWREDIPIIIITGGRIRYLYRLLASIGRQEGIRRDLFLLVTDGPYKDISLLADLLGLDTAIHKPEGSGPARVSRNLRFGLFTALRRFPKAEKFIVLEDDLILSPDFYSYMQQTGWLLENDPSIYCVSAFNHLSYTHTAHDPTRLYRVHTYPAYGWMTSRAVLEDILPKWLPSNVTHDWDYFIASDIIRRDRECIQPDVNRSYHGGATGLHLTASFATERDYLNRTYNMQPNVTLMDVERMVLVEYEREMHSLLAKAKPLDLNEFHRGNVNTEQGGVHVIFARQKDRSDELSFMIAGDILGVWNRDARDAHYYTWRLYYNNATLLVVGVPASKYSSYFRKGYEIYDVGEVSRQDIELQDYWSRMKIPILTHKDTPDFRMGSLEIPLLTDNNGDEKHTKTQALIVIPSRV